MMAHGDENENGNISLDPFDPNATPSENGGQSWQSSDFDYNNSPSSGDPLAIPGLESAAGDGSPPSAPSSDFASGDLASTDIPPPEGLQPAADLAGEVSPESAAAADALGKVKDFSEDAGLARTARESVPAALPFSLLIEGHLTPGEREKLLDLLSREQMGIREVDLEPQFTSGRILIPRISEYAGILLIQALRSSSCRMKLGLSDSIFATEDTREPAHPLDPAFQTGNRSYSTPERTHPAERIPISQGASIPGMDPIQVLDVITVSASLQTQSVETKHSEQYEVTMEALKRELRYKAYLKGASALLHFNIQLIPLSFPAQYRLILSASAVRQLPDPVSRQN